MTHMAPITLPELTSFDEDPFAYYAPLLSVGHLRVPIGADLDNAEITRAVVAKEQDRRCTDINDTKAEDSLLPYEHAEVAKLLGRIDGFIRQLNPHFEDMKDCETWGHILNPGQNTDYHTHIRDDWPDGLSWVYYSNYPENSGAIVFVLDAVARRNHVQLEPEVGTLLLFPSYAPHYTKRNMSEEKRVSISGNHFPHPKKAKKFQHYAETHITPYAHMLGIWA